MVGDWLVNGWLPGKRNHSVRIRQKDIGLRGISKNTEVSISIGESINVQRLVKKLIQFALRKNKRRRIHAVAVVQHDRSRYELRNGYQGYQQNRDGKQHFEKAEAGVTALRPDSHNDTEAITQPSTAQDTAGRVGVSRDRISSPASTAVQS